MTYKDKKLKEFDEEFEIYAYKPKALEFIAKTLDEILGCLPTGKGLEAEDLQFKVAWIDGFHSCRRLFLQNLEDKAGEL